LSGERGIEEEKLGFGGFDRGSGGFGEKREKGFKGFGL